MRGRLADGLYEQVVTGALAVDLASLDGERKSHVEALDTADSHSVLARHLALEVERALSAVPHAERVPTQLAIVNGLLDELHRIAGHSDGASVGAAGRKVEPPGRELLAVYETSPYERPRTPLGSSTLLTRSRAEPSLGGELAREVASADRIDVLVAFITLGGVRLLRDALEAFARRSTTEVRLRVLTTVFTQTTELEAVAAPAVPRAPKGDPGTGARDVPAGPARWCVR